MKWLKVLRADARNDDSCFYEWPYELREELKRRLPIWKREHYVDGRSEWVAGTTATADMGDARLHASPVGERGEQES